ncbi:MAG TPA: hypothetical protein PLR74_12675, partial [Agriterribacter sp.]|nr:hypothetical protein [Agriterribacter sp.]
PSPYNGNPYNDPNEARVYQKLDELNRALSEADNNEQKLNKMQLLDDEDSEQHRYVAELDKMMQQFNTAGESSGDSS